MWEQALLEGSSEQSLLRDGDGSSQTAETSVNIPEWEPNWMENFSDTYTESGPLDNTSTQVSLLVFWGFSRISPSATLAWMFSVWDFSSLSVGILNFGTWLIMYCQLQVFQAPKGLTVPALAAREPATQQQQSGLCLMHFGFIASLRTCKFLFVSEKPC